MTRLIDADVLKKYIDDCKCCEKCPEKMRNCNDGCEFPDFLTRQWERAIDEQPTVEAIPARYTYLRKSRNYPGAYECSECGVAYPQSVKNSGIILNYCSKCGAKFLRGESV